MQEYNVDGLRIDAAKHVEPGFWQPFCGESGAAGVFCIGEVYGPNVGCELTFFRIVLFTSLSSSFRY